MPSPRDLRRRLAELEQRHANQRPELVIVLKHTDADGVLRRTEWIA